MPKFFIIFFLLISGSAYGYVNTSLNEGESPSALYHPSADGSVSGERSACFVGGEESVCVTLSEDWPVHTVGGPGRQGWYIRVAGGPTFTIVPSLAEGSEQGGVFGFQDWPGDVAVKGPGHQGWYIQLAEGFYFIGSAR